MDKNNQCYTVITFAPIQAFIEKSRKLRDLYGSSYILSFLSWIICLAAEKQGYSVVSPALPNVTQGMPNQIVLQRNLSSDDIHAFSQGCNPFSDDIQGIQDAFNQGWKCLVDSCRNWIEQEVKEGKDAQGNVIQWDYYWQRDWQLWTNHCWEFFTASGQPGESITDVRQRLNQVKNARNWTGINWQGESSTLSGADAIAYPGLGRIADPRDYDYQQERTAVRAFYQKLSEKLGESFIKATPGLNSAEKDKTQEKSSTELNKKYGSSFIDPREELSIPELVKRLITHKVIVQDLVMRLHKLKVAVSEDEEIKLASFREDLTQIAKDLKPDSFRDLNRQKDDDSKEKKYWTGWFLGDGDSASKYFKQFNASKYSKEFTESKAKEEAEKLTEFSAEMRNWGKELCTNSKDYLQGKGRMIYAGGDDFLGVLYYPNKQIPPHDCLNWFYTFKSEVWHKPQRKKISASVGFVWAGNQVPQRDVLQHCHLAETSAKSTGRDRIAFRILFNSGNYLEWVCPWWLLDDADRQAFTEKNIPILPETSKNLIESYHDRDKGKNWTHFYQDVAILESRHAFSEQSIDIALGLIDIYFDSVWKAIIGNQENWWNRYNEHELQIFTGILGDPKRFNPEYEETTELRNELNNNPKVKEDFNNWVINLAKVGFYLTDNNGQTNQR
ncbi:MULTISPECIES: Cas10/Cmr2 second palm domain-containing protein [unclassified Coleofasciculus]|uniref:Cas10/Cmr2 second palm domain-containing protein n=1 Tax=unclassified Coleofasciculus TaxID=2692782 RepID=UPI00187ECE21|nr:MULTISPECIES: type III-B CRISPR-associated protein Cas10/Cmr2 [unclassified Coleofasciculus]MBE9127480.1 CRISPR-associated protein [Coleofasciculus sp. LEGE 07081]MBE9150752.1 CRISPR-associated protein [Coleofasciculus sp. LEGE 07092]